MDDGLWISKNLTESPLLYLSMNNYTGNQPLVATQKLEIREEKSFYDITETWDDQNNLFLSTVNNNRQVHLVMMTVWRMAQVDKV